MHMDLYGPLAYEQQLSDLLIGQAFAQEPVDVSLTLRKSVRWLIRDTNWLTDQPG